MATTGSSANALTALKVEDTGNESTAVSIAGVTPQALLGHTIARTYIMTGITPDEFIKTHSSMEFNFEELKIKFKKYCLDYNDNMQGDKSSYAADFCAKVLYEIGPESRRNKTVDRIWKLKFVYKESNPAATCKVFVKTVIIATYRSISYKESMDNADTMSLTVKQAGLLALETFCMLSDFSLNLPNGKILLTPLAGAIFSREDIPEIAKRMPNVPMNEIVKIINASCQSGAHYLTWGMLHCAIVAAIVSTRNIKDNDMAIGIIAKIIKQFNNKGAVWRPLLCDIFSEYAHGGVPSEMSPQLLIQNYENQRKMMVTQRQAKIASTQSTLKSTIEAPNPLAQIPGTSKNAPEVPPRQTPSQIPGFVPQTNDGNNESNESYISSLSHVTLFDADRQGGVQDPGKED